MTSFQIVLLSFALVGAVTGIALVAVARTFLKPP